MVLLSEMDMLVMMIEREGGGVVHCNRTKLLGGEDTFLVHILIVLELFHQYMLDTYLKDFMNERYLMALRHSFHTDIESCSQKKRSS